MFVCVCVADDNEIVITANRMEMPVGEVGNSITVIGTNDLERTGGVLADAMRGVPGVDVLRSGGPGTLTSMFIRGAKSEQTMFIIDGVKMNDPISSECSYNMDHLMLNNVERVEILRGPQSTLYGSEAIGGVVNVITKRGGKENDVSILAEAGSFNSLRAVLNASGSYSNIYYAVGIARFETDGFSAAGEKYGNTEDDGYENTGASLRVGLVANEALDFEVSAHMIDSEADIDLFGGEGGDDPNYTSEYTQMFVRGQGHLVLFNDFWEQRAGVSFSEHDRDYINLSDAAHPDDVYHNKFDSDILQADWQSDLRFSESAALTFGLESEEQSGKTETLERHDTDTLSAYLQQYFKPVKDWTLTAGLRLDDHSKVGSETTYRMASSYLVEKTDTRFRCSYGTGFKTPSLFQLYSIYGDENLDSEESQSWDAGIEQGVWSDKISVGATWFESEFDEMIDYDFISSRFANVSEADIKGVEAELSFKPADGFETRGTYTYTHTEDGDTGDELLRRPKDKYSLVLSYAGNDKMALNVSLIYMGKRNDVDPASFATTRVQSHCLVNAGASYSVNNRLRCFVRVENLFDEDYEEVIGYGTAGVSGYGGIEITL